VALSQKRATSTLPFPWGGKGGRGDSAASSNCWRRKKGSSVEKKEKGRRDDFAPREAGRGGRRKFVLFLEKGEGRGMSPLREQQGVRKKKTFTDPW